MSNNLDYEHFAEVYIKEFYQNFRKTKNMSEGRLETAIRVIRQGINLQVELNKNKLTDVQKENIKERLSERITTLDKGKDTIFMTEKGQDTASPQPKVEK